MKKVLLLISLLFLFAFAAKAQSVFTEMTKSDFTITDCTSLGKSVTISNGIVVSENSGTVSGEISFNTKTKTIKFSNKKIKYDPSSFIVKVMDSCCLTSGTGSVIPDGGDVVFQIIEDFRHNEINIIVGWPDNSSVRILASLKARKEL